MNTSNAGPRNDIEEISARLASGSRAALEEAALILDSFPHGEADGFGDGCLGASWLAYAAGCGAVAAVEWMIEQKVDLNRVEPDGYPALHACLDRTDVARHQIMALLVKAGADVNLRGTQDWTPLHLAAIRDDQIAMKMLIDAGADVSMRTRIDGCCTPSEEARPLGHNASAEFIDKYSTNRYPFNG